MGGSSNLKFPILYAKDATDFFNLGFGVLTNTIEAKVTEERNGSFFLEIKVLTDTDMYNKIELDSLIKVDAGASLKNQRFRVKRIIENHDGTADVYAEHISYLAQELSLKPKVLIKGNGTGALDQWQNAIIDDNPFVTSSTVRTETSTSWEVGDVANAREALGGVQGSILDKWGGEYLFDNYHIALKEKRGKTANALIAYGRNITDFEQEKNIMNTYTSLFPYARYTDDDQVEHLVTLPEYLVDSEYVGNYPNRKALPVDFSSEFESEDVPTPAKLRTLAKRYIKDNEVGIPKVSIQVSFLDLAKTLDYKEIAPLEELDLCDDVRVEYPKLGVSTVSKVVKTVWDVLADRYAEIEIGAKRTTLGTTIKEQNDTIKEIEKNSNNAQLSADGKNMIFYGLFGEDGLGEPTATKVGDLWYKPNGSYTIMYVWNGTVWEQVLNTEEEAIIKEEIKQMDKDVQAAKDKADEVALSLVDVQKDADEAKASAEQSKVDAGNAMVNASKAMSEANRALSRTNENKTSISGLTVKMDEVNANLELKATKQDLSKLDGTLKNHQTQITQNTTDIKTKANQTEVNTLKGTFTKQQTEIAQNATDIKRKAEKTVVDTINNMVKNHQTLISQNSEAVKIKADKSEVNNLERNVTKLQSTINLEAGKITNLTSNVNENSTNIGKLTIESNKISSQVVELQNQEISTQNFFPYSFVEPSFTINQNELTHSGTWAGPVVNNNNLRKMRLVGGEKYRIKYQFRLDEDPSSYIPFQQAQHGTLLFYSGVDHSKYPSIALGGTHNNVEDAKTWKKGTIVDREAVFVMPKDISPQTQYRIIGYTFRAMNKDGSFAKLLKGTFLNVTIQKGDVFTGWTPAPEDMATQSQITQLSDDILLRVKKGEIINQINVSSEGILIDGTKTHITGKTRIDNAVIKNAMIADGAISNAKIQNAAITSAKIAQLDAGKITFGTLSGITISGANSYWNLSNGLFKMTNPSNSGQYIQIQNGKFSSFNGASKQISIQNDELAATSGSKKIALNPERLTFTGEGYHRTVELQGQGITISSLGQPNVGANYLNAGIEIESKGTQAYIDFRTGGRKNDFDARIKSVDGNDTNGQGTLQFEAKEVQVMSPTFKLRGTNSIDFNGATAISAPKNMIMTALNGDNSVLSIEKAGSHSNHYFNFRMRGLNHGIKDWGVSTWASDERLKRNIAPTKLSGKGLINRLNVVEFDWKTDGYHEPMGLIAQEVEKILPNAVFENLSDIKQLRSEAFIPVLIKAVQELKGDIDRISRQVVDLQLMRIGE